MIIVTGNTTYNLTAMYSTKKKKKKNKKKIK